MGGARLKTPEELWYGAPAGPGLGALRAVLTPVAAAYGAAARTHRALYARGLLTARRAPIPVLAVGNVVAGGAGKTPVTVMLARLAQQQNIKVAVLSRGYGASVPSDGRVVSDGTHTVASAADAGDEPVLMARQLPGAAVLVGADRARLAVRAHQEMGTQLALLDDGMQHHRLHHDALVAVARVPRPLGNGRVLPAGPLREDPRALRAAHTIILLGRATEDDRAELTRLGIPDGRLLEAQLHPTRCVALPHGGEVPLAALRNTRVMAAAAIGRPAAFADTLKELGAEVVALRALPDHALPDVTTLAAEAAGHGAHALLITEKDAVKLPTLPALPVPVWSLQVELRLDSPAGEQRLRALLGTLTGQRLQSAP